MGVPMSEVESKNSSIKQISFCDIFAQYELKKVMQQLNPSLKKKRIYKMQIIFASLVYNTLMSPEYFKAMTGRKLHPMKATVSPNFQHQKILETYINNCNVDNEETNAIPNMIGVAIIGDQLVFIKENYEQYMFFMDPKTMKTA
jgi:hypothetical protein